MSKAIGIKFSDSISSVGVVKTDEDIVAEAIHRIINTSIGERVHQPDFGSRIQELLFEPNDFASISLGAYFINEAIAQWEPRVEILQIIPKIKESSGNRKTMSIDIIFRYKDDPQTVLRTSTTVG